MTVVRRRWLLAFFAALGLAAWVLYPSRFFQGQILSQQPERAAAIAYFREYLARHPNHKGASLALAAVYESIADPESAIKVLSAFYEHRKGDRVAGEAYLDILERAGDLDAAQAFKWRLFEDTRGLPETDRAWLEGLLYDFYQRAVLVQDDASARKALEALQTTAAKPGSFFTELLNHHISRGQHAEAKALLTRRLDKDPRDFQTRSDLVYLLLALKEQDAALGVIEAGLALKPDSVELLGERAGIFADRGRCAEALADFKRLTAMRPREPYYRQGLVASALKCRPLEDAAGLAGRLLANHPEDQEVWKLVIYAYADRGLRRPAADWLERYRRRFPEDPDAVELLAAQYEALGDKLRAARLLAGFASGRPEDGAAGRRAAFSLLGAGSFREAEPFLKAVVARDPRDKEAWWALIYGYGDAKRHWPAADALKRYLAVYPGDAKAYDQLAQLYLVLDRKGRAVELLQDYFAPTEASSAAPHAPAR